MSKAYTPKKDSAGVEMLPSVILSTSESFSIFANLFFSGGGGGFDRLIYF
jgi:hypothetical protein